MLGLAYNNIAPENICVQTNSVDKQKYAVLTNFENCIIKSDSFKNMELTFRKTDINIKRKSIEINN